MGSDRRWHLVVRHSPGQALIWASAIADPALRIDTQVDVARTWNLAAPGAAAAWIAVNLPPEAQRRARSPE
jgi:hypothetical protein